MTKIVDLDTYAAAQTKAQESVPPKNELLAILQIYALLRDAMAENVLASSHAGQVTSEAMQKVLQIVQEDYKHIEKISKEIQEDTSRMQILGYIGLAFGIAAAVAGGIAFASSAATAMGAATLASGTSSVIGGGAEIGKGAYQVQVARNTASLADVNADVSLWMGQEQGIETMNKWLSQEAGKGAGGLASVAQAVSNDIASLSQGIMSVSRDAGSA